MSDNAQYVNITTAAEILACSRSTVRRMIRLGSIRGFKLNPGERSGVRIPIVDIAALVDAEPYARDDVAIGSR